jgi:flagellar protein FliO/FliZ
MEFFSDLSVPAKLLIAFVVVLAVLGVGRYLMRRFSGGKGPRGQQPRLALIDTASVDGSRRLVLVRRDNVEHLLLIGGPTDVLVEPNIARTGAAAPAPAPVRETKASPTLEPPPRQPLSLEGSGWPPGEPAYVEPPPAMTGEAILRPQSPVGQRVESLIEDAPPAPIGGPTDIVVEPNIARTGAAATAPAPVRETKASPTLEPSPRQPPSLEGAGWPPGEPAYVEPPPPPPVCEAIPREPMPREPASREAMTGEAMLRPPPVPVERQGLESLIEDAGATRLLPTPPPEPGPSFYQPPVPPSFEPVAHAPPAPPPFAPVFQIPPAREPKRMPAEPPLRPRAPQNEESSLAEIEQWLEAALRRPIKPVEPVPSPPPPQREVATPEVTAREPAPPEFPKEPAPVPADKSARPTPAFTSIQEEMASLLGRSTGKS